MLESAGAVAGGAPPKDSDTPPRHNLAAPSLPEVNGFRKQLLSLTKSNHVLGAENPIYYFSCFFMCSWQETQTSYSSVSSVP